MVQFLIALVIIGAALYPLQLIPMDATIKKIVQAIAIVVVVIWAIKTLLPIAGLG